VFFAFFAFSCGHSIRVFRLTSITMSKISLFEEKQLRRTWGTNEDKWMFANVDVTAILTDSPNPQVYRCVMKKRLSDEGNQTVTNCHGLKMTATVGKQRMTDIADTEQLLRLIRSVPSPKDVPFKRWVAKVGYERLEEIENPELAASCREGFQLTSWPPNRIPAPDPQPSEGAQSADSSTVPQTPGGSFPHNPPLFLHPANLWSRTPTRVLAVAPARLNRDLIQASPQARPEYSAWLAWEEGKRGTQPTQAPRPNETAPGGGRARKWGNEATCSSSSISFNETPLSIGSRGNGRGLSFPMLLEKGINQFGLIPPPFGKKQGNKGLATVDRSGNPRGTYDSKNAHDANPQIFSLKSSVPVIEHGHSISPKSALNDFHLAAGLFVTPLEVLPQTGNPPLRRNDARFEPHPGPERPLDRLSISPPLPLIHNFHSHRLRNPNPSAHRAQQTQPIKSRESDHHTRVTEKIHGRRWFNDCS
jgi:hypothetical protein